MGIDWFRMRPNRDACEEELACLANLQAEAFQGLPSMWSTEQVEPPKLIDDEEVRRLERQYKDSSRALRELLDVPTWDDSDYVPDDHPELAPCRRVYPITQNTIFPPQWRVQAHRTYLPGPLRDQLGIWRDWISAVLRGENRPYLLDLHLYDATVRLNCLYPDIRNAAQQSLSSTGRWASKPDLAAVRDRIFAFEVPPVHAVPAPPRLMRSEAAVNLSGHRPYQLVTQKLRELVALTRSWDANVRQSRKIRYYEGHYYMTFDEFLDQANAKRLHEFLEWVEACCDRGMGLFLDY